MTCTAALKSGLQEPLNSSSVDTELMLKCLGLFQPRLNCSHKAARLPALEKGEIQANLSMS